MLMYNEKKMFNAIASIATTLNKSKLALVSRPNAKYDK